MGVHPVHLCRIVRRYTGPTVRDYVRRERIVAGSRLLRSSDESVSRVAHDAGFADHSHFTREFVRRYGHVPSVDVAKSVKDVVSIQAEDLPAVHLGVVSTRQGSS